MQKDCRQPSAVRVSGLLVVVVVVVVVVWAAPWPLYTEGVQRWDQRHGLREVLVVFLCSSALEDLLSVPLLLALLLLQTLQLLLQLV